MGYRDDALVADLLAAMLADADTTMAVFSRVLGQALQQLIEAKYAVIGAERHERTEAHTNQ